MPAAAAPTPTPAAVPPAIPAPSTPTTPAAPAQSVLGLEPAPAAPDAQKAPGAETPEVKPAETPAELTVKWPEGLAVDEAVNKDFLAVAKEVGLDGEKTQKLADFYAKVQSAQAERALEQQRVWGEALASDKEFGGQHLEASKVLIGKAMGKFSTPALREALNSTGLGNHPELVRFVYRVGKALSEDSVAGTSSAAPASPANSTEALHRALYPTMFPKD